MEIKKITNKKTAVTTVLLLLVIFVAAALALYNNAKFGSLLVTTPNNQPAATTTQTRTQTNTATASMATTTTTRASTAASPTTVITNPPSIVTLEIKSWGFNPDAITIAKGSTATWTNKDGEKHTVTSSGNFDSGDIAAGGSWSYTFNSIGVYEYSCKYHPSITGKITVN
jgi:plastocyanin